MQESVLPVQPHTSAATVSAPLSMIPLDLIDEGTRLRTVDEAQVGALVDSIKEVGLLNPITVYRRQVIRADVFVDGYGIVAGAHRTTAGRRLGWTEIAAHIVELSDLQRQIAECDENLQGPKLTASQRALFTRRRKEAYEALHPETRQGSAGAHAKHGSASDKLSFAEQTAAATGRDKRSVQRDAARGEALGEDAALIIGTSLDNGVELDALASMTPEERKPIIDRAAAGEKVTARKAQPDRGPAEESIEAKAELVDRIRAALREAVAENNISIDYAGEDRETTPLDVVACLLGFDGAYASDDALDGVQAALFAILDMPADPWPGLTRADLNLMIKGRQAAAQRMGIRRFPDSYEVGLREKTLLAARRDWIESAPAITPETPTTEKLAQVAPVSERSPHGADAAAEFALAPQTELVPSTPAPLSVVPTAGVSGNLPETIRPADKITHLIAAKHAPKSYPGAGERWKQRHGRH